MFKADKSYDLQPEQESKFSRRKAASLSTSTTTQNGTHPKMKQQENAPNPPGDARQQEIIEVIDTDDED